ncbi:hypothetical protein [Desulfobacula phenolica]|uniref:Uncharacterized protein n=1 Tax=Desulfobacula phenolica TaxID=90732 RepID=A0A1H2H4F3_9BACT|nr:hypothetical protein [Desulfobacula phenolica]SDU26716.1 hypothetical protein SAMN04487931_10641 [Desulfobacula phenolica]
MKELLDKIQTELQSRLNNIRDVDIFITPHANLIPGGTQFPAIGIKDGTVKRHELAGGEELDKKQHVSLIPYVKMYPGEQSIMGGSGFKGILEFVEDLHEILDKNLLGIEGMEAAFCENEKESEMFGKPGDGLQRKIIIYKYERRSER